MSNNNAFPTGTLLGFVYFKKQYKLIAIDLSKQTKLKDPHLLILLENFQEKLEQECLLILLRNQKKLLLIFHNYLNNGNRKTYKFI